VGEERLARIQRDELGRGTALANTDGAAGPDANLVDGLEAVGGFAGHDVRHSGIQPHREERPHVRLLERVVEGELLQDAGQASWLAGPRRGHVQVVGPDATGRPHAYEVELL